MIREVCGKLKNDLSGLAPLRVYRGYGLLHEYKGNQPVSELAGLVALSRRVCGIDSTISPHAETVRRNFQNWIMTQSI